MNDKFAAQLRQHLLDTANERPADGQLATVIEHIDATVQRHPLAARLTWFPGRIGPLPTATFRYGLIAAALTLVTVVAALLVGASSQPSTVFEATWTATDVPDGSTQFLIVGAGNFPVVQYVDEFATGQGCVNDAIKRFTADGAGTIVGNRMSIAFPNGGGCGSTVVEVAGDDLRYDAATDRIVGTAFSWTRVPGGAGPTLRPLATGPFATIVPATIPPELQACIDLPAGATYRQDVGGLSLTVTIPGAAKFEWQGYRGGFLVSTSCWWDYPISIHASIVTTVGAACDAEAWTVVSTPAEAVAALANPSGFAISEPTSVTLDGHTASRFEVASDARMCFDEVLLWDDATVQQGTTTIMYLVDVEGLSLGIKIDNRRDEAPLAQLAEAEAILASLQIGVVPGPRPSSAPAVTPDPGCIQFHGKGTYKAPVGPLSVSVKLPEAPAVYWHGLRDTFTLLRAPCSFDGPLQFKGSLVTQVPPDACHWEAPGTEVADSVAAAAALVDQAGTDATGQTELTIDGYPAVRLDISVAADFDTTNCDGGGQIGLWPLPEGETARIQEGEHMAVYLVDVGGSILAITEFLGPGEEVEDPTLLEQIDEIIGSLRIQP